MNTRIRGLLVVGILATAEIAGASTVTVNPVDDGYIQNGTVATDSYLFVVQPGDREARGFVEFPTTAFAADFTNARLSVNAYGLPLFVPVMRVYGYESENGILDLADYDAGQLLGDWTVPEYPGYGEPLYFDVTEFLRSIESPYVGFRLVALPVENFLYASNAFSSLEYNYGAPAQLIVTSAVPEPGTLPLLVLGLLGMILLIRGSK